MSSGDNRDVHYRAVPDRDFDELTREVAEADDYLFAAALRSAAYHRLPEQFEQLLAIAARRELKPIEQWGVAEAVIVMVEARGIVPNGAVQILQSMADSEPPAASRAEALELIDNRISRDSSSLA